MRGYAVSGQVCRYVLRLMCVLFIVTFTGHYELQQTVSAQSTPPATPTIDPGSGTYANDVTVTIYMPPCFPGGCNGTQYPPNVVHYTLDGTEPTLDSPTYSSSLVIGSAKTLKAKAWWLSSPPGADEDPLSSTTASATYAFTAATPTFSPPGSTYTTGQSVTLSTATSGATIRYTTDGSTPTTSSPAYTAPLSINTHTTVSAIAFKNGYAASSVATATYTFNLGTLAAPTISPGTNTYNNDVSVTLSSSQSGATVRYTLDGSDPTASSTLYSAPLSITSAKTIKAKAFHPDYTTSPTASADYTFVTATPTLNPAAGTYTTAQNVSLSTATSGATIRYTTDGSTPTTASTPYASPIAVNTQTTLSAKAFKTGYTDSAVASAAYTFNFGTLSMPTATPTAGTYSHPQSVMLSADPGASIHYTLDGSVPTEASSLYTAPISLSATTTLKARAFRVDWTPSPILQATYTFSSDATGPNVTARVLPAPNAAGWNNTPVTVSFTCDDPSGVATCPSPVTVTDEGAGIQVTGVAVDTVGNQTTKTVTVNIDRTPPVVTFLTPDDGLTVTSSTINMTGTATDALSGVATARCNTAATTPSGTQVACTTALGNGINVMIITAVDAAGNSASVGRTVTRVGTSTTLAISPVRVLLVASTTRTVQLRDEFGVSLDADSWESADTNIATIDATGGEATITAVANGTTTITAHRQGLSASATVAVLTAGTSPSPGTVLWSISPYVNTIRLDEVFRADPTDSSFYSYFATERDQNDQIVSVRAIDDVGVERARFASLGQAFFAHAQGGFVGYTSTALYRQAPPPGHQPWSYESDRGIGSVVQNSTGTIYVVTDSYVDVVDGDSGMLLHREPLPTGLVRCLNCGGTPGNTVESVYHPLFTGPLVDSEDRFRLPFGILNETTDWLPFEQVLEMASAQRLLTITGVDVSYIDLQTGWFVPDYSRALADEQGVAIQFANLLPRDGADGGISYVQGLTASFTPSASAGWLGATLVGEGQLAYTYQGTGLMASHTTDGSTAWSSSLQASPITALTGGRIAALGADADHTLYTIDASGTAAAVGLLPLSRPILGPGGDWVGLNTDDLTLNSMSGAGERAAFTFLGLGFGDDQKQGGPGTKCVSPSFEADWKSIGAGKIVKYRIIGTAWTNEQLEAVARAFERWTIANKSSGLNTSFVPAQAGEIQDITVRKGAIPPKNGLPVGAQTSPGDVDANGFISGASITITTDTSILSNGEGYLKAMLHEIGHVVGLADASGDHGSSVMNQLSRRPPPFAIANDPNGNIPTDVTSCDQDKALRAVSRSWPPS